MDSFFPCWSFCWFEEIGLDGSLFKGGALQNKNFCKLHKHSLKRKFILKLILELD